MLPRMFEPLLPLRTDADLVAMADELVGEPLRRQVWVFLLDDEQRLAPLVVPMDGVPADPAPDDVARMAERIHLLVEAVPEAVTAVLVWERAGSADPRMQEADWIAALAASGAPIRAQLLATDAGAAVVDPAFATVVGGVTA
jgi:hypothetical protein